MFDENKVKGALYGSIVGDALGVPFEFHGPDQIPPKEQIDYILPENFRKSYRNIKVGTWSDDSAGMLCLLDSLLQCKKLNLRDFGNKLIKWMVDGLWAVDNNRFDIGCQTQSSLIAFKMGTPPEQSGFVTDSQGNGSLMRIISLPIWYLCNGGNNDEELVKLAHKSSIITHGHINNQVCCGLYCLFVKYLLYNNNNWEDCYKNSIDSLFNIYKSEEYNEYKSNEDDINNDYINGLQLIINNKIKTNYGSGYVIDTLLTVIKSLNISNSYEEVVRTCISYGDDTDTTACIAGGIAGIIYGYNNIPQRWLDGLRDKHKVDELYEKFKTEVINKNN